MKPRTIVVGDLHGCFDEFRAGREVREPDIVVIEAGKVILGHAARRTPYRAQSRALAFATRRAELNDIDGHMSLTTV